MRSMGWSSWVLRFFRRPRASMALKMAITSITYFPLQNATWRIVMTTHTACSAIAVMALSALTANMATAQLMPTCVENSPERRGELGCSIIENKLLPDGLKEPLFWHIDRFDSAERARMTVSAAGVAFDAVGTSWLMTIEAQTSDHHGGRHDVPTASNATPAALTVMRA